MEEFLIIVVQLAVEVIAQSFLLFPLESLAWQRDTADSPGGCGWLLISCMVGAALGGLSVAIAPHLILPHVGLRLLNVILSPIAVGGFAYWLAQGRMNISQRTHPTYYFWLGFVFSMSFTLIRLAFGDRYALQSKQLRATGLCSNQGY